MGGLREEKNSPNTAQRMGLLKSNVIKKNIPNKGRKSY